MFFFCLAIHLNVHILIHTFQLFLKKNLFFSLQNIKNELLKFLYIHAWIYDIRLCGFVGMREIYLVKLSAWLIAQLHFFIRCD